MESNFNDRIGGDTPSVGGAGGRTGGSPTPGSAGFESGSQRADTSFSGAPGTMGNQSTTDKVSDRFGKAKEKIGERAGELKTSLADKLEQGAEKLRQRSTSGGQYAGATGDGSVGVSEHDKVHQLTDKVAGGMQTTADWVRNADMESVKTDIERQVKEHPARSLLVAVGLGYLLGKAFRR
jgi:ElaB/YqjD/DUF883 family membrane-anchored ribosome-binding protein